MSTKQKRRTKYLAFTVTPVLLLVLMVLVPAMSMGEGEPPQVSAEYVTCTECHNGTTLLTGKKTAWEESGHGTGEAYLRGTSKSCAGCHSGGGFSGMVAAGKAPNQLLAGDPDPTRQDCRACHQTHDTYTSADWGLETTTAVNLYALTSKTFDGGKGNLCATCHQPRSKAPVASSGQVTGISTHWGPHHGPQSSMMLGTGGAGAEGTPAAHYESVGDTCVGCHMGSGDNHSFDPSVTTCKTCHTGASSFDVGGVQTETQAKLDQLEQILVDAGLLACEVDEEGVEECHPAVTSAPENQANALWNWILIAKEDGSRGVHNPGYTEALLNTSLDAMCDGAPGLGIGVTDMYWASLADYNDRLLSVRYSVYNLGGTDALNFDLTNSSVTNGVTLASTLPATAGSITSGASAQMVIRYNVPPGVPSFRATNGATAQDNCDITYLYGTQPASP